MNIDTVLVPVDGSQEAVEAAEYAVAIAERYGASVHALYVLGEGVVRGIETGDLTEEVVAEGGESFVETVRSIAGDVPISHSVVYGFSLSRISQHPGSVILDTADEVDADFIVIPREPVTGDPHAVIEKAAEYVLAHASQPVLSV